MPEFLSADTPLSTPPPEIDLMSRDGKAVLPLSFLIVGGGIGGLTCAHALQKVGHRVTVLEESDGQFKSPWGIRCPPNMTRHLYEWGLGPALEELAIKASGISFRIAETGEKIGMTVFHKQIMKAFRADFLFVQHGQIYSLLTSLALTAGAQIRYNAAVIDIDPYGSSSHSRVPSSSTPSRSSRASSMESSFDPSGRPCVTLASGEVLSADVIVGADGRDSIIRKVVNGRGEEDNQEDSFWSLNMSISTESMKGDEDLDELTEDHDWTIWMGDGYGVYGCLTNDKSRYSLDIIWPAASSDNLRPESWLTTCPVGNVNWERKGMETRLQKLIRLAKIFTPARDMARQPIENWVHESGRVVLTGDAAHPLLPTGSHHVAMAVEDAVTLSHLLSHLTRPSHLPLLLAAYEEIRQPRTQLVELSEARKRTLVSMPEGPEQRARDGGFREALRLAMQDLTEVDEEYLRNEWDEYIQLFGHDAGEVVEDWWTKWGALVRRGVNVAANGLNGVNGHRVNGVNGANGFKDIEHLNLEESAYEYEGGMKSPEVEVSVSSISDDIWSAQFL